MKGRTALATVGVALLAALVVWKACSSRDEPPRNLPGSPDLEASAKGPRAARTGALSASGSLPAPAKATAKDGATQDGPRVVFFSPWGSRGGDLGRERPAEGNPEGPMSLSLDSSGRVLVLDQVNNRIVRHGADGKLEATIPLTQTGAQDIVSAKDGSTAVLDRLVDKSIAVYDEGGALRGSIPLQGPGIEEPGLVTGVFTDGDDIYVEREHGPLVLVGHTSGKPAAARVEIPGRPSRDGLSFLNAGITDAAAARVYVSSIDRATHEHRFTRELRLDAPVTSLVLLDSDKHGTIYFGAQIERAPGSEAVVVLCLEPSKGAPLGSLELPVNTLPEETFRDLAVQDDGSIVYSLRSDEGVTYQRYQCP